MNTKPIYIQENKRGKIYFLSDAHINHNRPWIVDVRGFKTINEHDEWIIEQLYSLTPDDILINLGDFTLMSSVEFTRELFQNIKARHYYAAFGNHESFVSKIYYENVANQYPTIAPKTCIYPLEVFFNSNITSFHGESCTFKIEKSEVYCRHMAPLIWDHMKYADNMCLVGHSHGNLTHADLNSTEPKILDIGVDNAKKYNGTCFFTWDDIKKIMSNKNVKTYDHHN